MEAKDVDVKLNMWQLIFASNIDCLLQNELQMSHLFLILIGQRGKLDIEECSAVSKVKLLSTKCTWSAAAKIS